MASRQQIRDMLTCAAVAGQPGYSLKKLERWVNFFCNREHPDFFHLSDKARAKLPAFLEKHRGGTAALSALDGERARGIAIVALAAAGIEATRLRQQNTAHAALRTKRRRETRQTTRPSRRGQAPSG